jgi:hypothetical protein
MHITPTEPRKAVHRNLRNIVSSYNSAWDPLGELVQNAIDAIDQRAGQEAGAFRGKLVVSVDAGANSITVEDNGIGIPPNSADMMILPGGSLKTTGNTYGHKGLGFTYCAHIADSIEVETEELSAGRADRWTFNGGFDWLADGTRSSSLEPGLSTPLRSLSGPGTSVRLRFAIGRYEANIANTSVLDTFFEWAADAKLLPFVLRTRTAVGQVGPLFGQGPPIDVDVEARIVPGHAFPVAYSFFDFQSYAPLNQQNFPRATDYATQVYLNPRYPNKTHYGIYHVFDQDTMQRGEPLSVGKTHGGVSFSAYVCACGKDNLATALAQYDPRLATEFRHLAFTTDVHLAIDGMPCGVPVDSWNNFGAHEQRYFAMVNAELAFGTVLDAGRKTITRYYVDTLTEKIVEMTKSRAYFSGQVSFYELSTQLHSRAAPPTRTPLDYLQRWAGYPPLGSPALLLNRVPDNELGTYCLFAELVGRGCVPGYKILYLSGGAIYDAALQFELNLQNPRHLNSSAGGSTKFAVGQALVQERRATREFPSFRWQNPATGQTHLVTEFKVEAEELLRDVQKRRSDKQVQDVNLLVCVTFDEEAIRNLQGALVPVSDAARRFSGVTHELSFAGYTLQVICLRTIVEELEVATQLPAI